MKQVRLAAMAAALIMAVLPCSAREPRVDDFRIATPEELAMTGSRITYADQEQVVLQKRAGK
jgi:hypothetical protein